MPNCLSCLMRVFVFMVRENPCNGTPSLSMGPYVHLISDTDSYDSEILFRDFPSPDLGQNIGPFPIKK